MTSVTKENTNIEKSSQPMVQPQIIIPKLISLKEVSTYTGLSRSSIYDMLDEESSRYDPTFPKKVHLSKVRVAWVAEEVGNWIKDKIEARSA